MDIIIKIIIYLMLFLMVYPLIVYPLILWFMSLLFSKKVKEDDNFTPSVSFIISAYNEDKYIESSIKSILSLDYPLEKIEILVGSDGSTDKTNKILRSLSNQNEKINFFEFQRIGKNKVINHLIKETKNELLYFLDADMNLGKNHLRNIAPKMADQEVGGVVSSYKSKSDKENTGSKSEKMYQFFENTIRRLESKIYTVTNALGGGLYRKKLIKDLPNDLICDDLYHNLDVAKQGKRVIFENQISKYEIREKSLSNEIERRKRTSSCSLATIFSIEGLLSFRNPILSFFIWSHKMIRYFSMFYITLLILVTFLLSPSEFKEWMLLVNYFIVVSFYSAYVFEKTDVKFSLLKAPLFYFLMIWGFMLGFFRFISKKPNSVWNAQGFSKAN